MKKSLFFSLTLVIVNICFAQNFNMLNNPSLEGPNCSYATAPEGWNNCAVSSTPDILPGCWNIQFPPSDGNSYVNLVKRDDGSVERIHTYMNKELDTNKCYIFSTDVAYRNEFLINDIGVYDFTDPASLAIGFGFSTCWNLVDTIMVINDPNLEKYKWHTFTTQFKPTQNLQGFQIRVFQSQPFKYGHVFIDNIRLVELADITVAQSEIFEANENDIVFIGIDANPNNSYQWIEGNVSCLNCSSNEITASSYENFVLEEIDSLGCVNHYIYKISVPPVFPNVFTPNNDGVNDYFSYNIQSDRFSMQITNRWGQVVFETNDSNQFWDGQNSIDGVYFYTVEYETILGERKQHQGFVHLKRD